MEAGTVDSMNFLGGREQKHTYWNIPVADRDAKQVPAEYRTEALTVKPNY